MRSVVCIQWRDNNMDVFWDVAPRILVGNDRRFGGAYCLRHQGDKSLITLMVEAVRSSEESVNIYQNTRCNIPQDIENRFTSHTESLYWA
jgi:hypothetical protein